MEGGFAPDAPVEAADKDIANYYKLVQDLAPGGYLRTGEVDEKAEKTAREAEELAADRAEEARFAALARNARIGETIAALAVTRADRPEAREAALSALAARDPAAVAQLLALMDRAAGAGGDAHARGEVLGAVKALLAVGGARGEALANAEELSEAALKALALPLHAGSAFAALK